MHRAESRKVPRTVIHCPLPVVSWTTPLSRKQCVTIHREYCQTGKFTEALVSKLFTGIPWWLASVSSSAQVKLITTWLKDSPHVTMYYFRSRPKSSGKKRLLSNRTFKGLREDLPEEAGKDQTSLWTRLCLHSILSNVDLPALTLKISFYWLQPTQN